MLRAGARPECDPVRERIAEEKRRDRRDSRVLERTDELCPVAADRVPVVPPRPGERVTDFEGARPQRLVRKEAEGNDEEEREIQQAGCKQEIRRQPSMPVQEPHELEQGHLHQAEIRFCQDVRYFWLLRADASMILTLSSIFWVGKMRGFLATPGSSFSSASFAPLTGQM